MTKIKYILLILISIFYINIFAQKVNVVGHLSYSIAEGTNDVTIKISKHSSNNFTGKGTKINTVTSKNGKFSTNVDLKGYYLFEISKKGFISQKIGLSTNAAKKYIDKGYLKDCELDITMYKMADKLNIALFKKPIAKYRYDKDEAKIDIDLTYEDKIKPKLNTFVKKQKSALKKEYNKNYNLAKNSFRSKKYAEAWLFCNKALTFLPKEKEAKKKVKEIQGILGTSSNINKLYKDALLTANNLYNSLAKNKTVSKKDKRTIQTQYEIALLYKPKSKEVNKQLALLDKPYITSKKTSADGLNSATGTSPFLTAKGTVKTNNNTLKDVTINIKVGGKIIKTERNNSDGTFSLGLNKNKKYIIAFEKEGFVSKKFLLSTFVKPKDAGYIYEFDFDKVDLFKMVKGLDISALKKPYGKISFAKKNFKADQNYKKKMINEELKILAQLTNINDKTQNDNLANIDDEDDEIIEIGNNNSVPKEKEQLKEIIDKNQDDKDTENESKLNPIVEKMNHNSDINETDINEIQKFNSPVNYKARIDSLQNILSKNLEPAKSLDILNNLANSYFATDSLNNALTIFNKVLSISDSLNNKEAKSKALNNLGILYDDMFNFNNAISYYKKSLTLYKELGNDNKISEMNYRIGNAYYQNNDFGKAINYFAESLEKDKEIKNDDNIAATYNNMGVMFYEMKDYDGAISYYEKSIEILEKSDKKKELSMSYNNIGNVNYDWEKYDDALSYYEKSLKIKKGLQYKKGIAISIHNIGNVYKSQEKYEKALNSYSKSLDIAEKSSFYDIKYKNYNALSELYALQGDCNKSLKYYKLFAPALALGKNFSKQLSEMQDKYQSDYLKKNVEITALKSELKRERLLAKYEANQNEIELAKKDVKIKEHENKAKIQQIVIITSILGLIGVLIFLLLLYKENKQKRRANIKLKLQRDSISKQKEEILTQKIELTDSILYAKRIQTAILPPEKHLSKDLPEHFVLYKPKNIVSGDFYWMARQGNKMLFAASDCTGHGVPGAFMSMLGIAFLNEIINKRDNLSAAEILNQLRAQVIKSLHQTGKDDEAKDGMDIAFCILDLDTNELEFAGANNPLYIVRNSNKELKGINKLEIIKPDKMPIGIYYRRTGEAFSNNKIQLNKDDSIYIFSDGYADQFGGPKGKKFKTKQFKNMILDLQGETMNKQKEAFNSKFETWKGELEQIDDILVIGMKI